MQREQRCCGFSQKYSKDFTNFIFVGKTLLNGAKNLSAAGCVDILSYRIVALLTNIHLMIIFVHA